MNRVYSLVHPDRVSLPFSYASAIVLPLMGFWNSVIFFTTSWAAVKMLFVHARKVSVSGAPLQLPKHKAIEVDKPMTLAKDRRSVMQAENWSQDSLRGLANIV